MRAPLLVVFSFACAIGSGQQIVTVAGSPPNHRTDIDGKNALNAPLNQVYGLLLDRATGRLIIHDQTLVERLEPDGTLLALAGIGASTALDSQTADGIPASALRIGLLRGMAQDSAGALYLADAEFGIIFRVERDGTVTKFAGPPPALGSPRGMVFDSHGNLDVADAYCHCIRQIDPTGAISILYTLPPSATYTYFEGLAIDAHDNLFATEFAGSQVLKIAADGAVTTIAGTGLPGFSGDGGPALAAQLQGPTGIAIAPDGTLYIGDTLNNRIRRITPDGIISTTAGTGARGFAGDGGPAISATLGFPAQVLLDGNGNLYLADFLTGRIRMIAAGGVITTIAGNGDIGHRSEPPDLGDGGPAIHAVFNQVTGVAFDPSGNLFVSEALGNRVRKIAPDGIITTAATVNQPYSVATDAQGNVYVPGLDGRVRKIDPQGAVTVVAGGGDGTGAVRSQGDGGPAILATLNEPKGVAVDAAGNIFIADTSNARVRRVDRNGVIRTVAGPGQQGVDYWNAVAIDGQGNLFVGTTHAGTNLYSQVQRVNSDGSLTPIAGNGQPCSAFSPVEFAYDGAQATQVPLCIVIALTFDAQGMLYISEPWYGAVLKMAPDGTVTRVAGSIHANTSGDGGPARNASLIGYSGYSPNKVAVDSAGNLFIPQSGANRIREVTMSPVTLKLSQDKIQWTGRQSQSVTASIQAGDPLPYLVRLPADAPWLTANRTSGLLGESITLTGDPSGLPPGVYQATVTVIVPDTLQATLPVTLTVGK